MITKLSYFDNAACLKYSKKCIRLGYYIIALILALLDKTKGDLAHIFTPTSSYFLSLYVNVAMPS